MPVGEPLGELAQPARRLLVVGLGEADQRSHAVQVGVDGGLPEPLAQVGGQTPFRQKCGAAHLPERLSSAALGRRSAVCPSYTPNIARALDPKRHGP